MGGSDRPEGALQMTDGDDMTLVWATVLSDGGGDPMLVVLPRSTFSYWMERLDVLYQTTWGELRENVSKDVYDEVAGLLGYGTFEEYTAHLAIGGAVPLPGVQQLAADAYDPDTEPPGDNEPFSVNEIPAYCDGDWPPAVGAIMEEELPEEVLEKYADRRTTSFNGTFAEILASYRDPVLDHLRSLGYELIEEPALADLTNCRY